MQISHWKLRWKVLGTLAFVNIAYILIVYQPWSADKQLLRDFKRISLFSWEEDQNGLAHKHFPIAMSHTDAEARLLANGFSANTRPDERQIVGLGVQHDMVMVGSRSALRFFPLPGGERLLLAIYFKDDKVVAARGYLWGDTI